MRQNCHTEQRVIEQKQTTTYLLEIYNIPSHDVLCQWTLCICACMCQHELIHTHTHMCHLHITRFIHNAERINGSCILTACPCVMLSSSGAAAALHCFTYFLLSYLSLSLHVSCSLGVWHQHITQLLAKSFFFFFSFTVFPST